MTQMLPSDSPTDRDKQNRQEDGLFAADGAPNAAAKADAAQPSADGLGPLLPALEALLFVACEPLKVKDLARLLDVSPAAVTEAAEELVRIYADRGFNLCRIAGGYQFVTPERYAFLVEKLYRPKYQQLSASALEALAVIAYKQPITRAEVAAVRQVDSDSVINTLLEKKLIREVGRVNAAGRAILYGTGPEFLSFFGLDSLSELPSLQTEPEAELSF